MKFIFSLFFLFLALPLYAAVDIIHGDMDQDGDIDTYDISWLADVLVQRKATEQWQASEGEVVASAAVSGTSDLCCDINHDRVVNVRDLVLLITLAANPSKQERVIVKEGCIAYINGSGFEFIFGNQELTDDGIIEF